MISIRFTTTANRSRARSQETSSLLALNYYQRSRDTTQAVDNLHAGIFYRGSERSLSYTADTTGYKVQSAGISGAKWWNLGRPVGGGTGQL
ncbi:MAG: hypothetical protein U5J63_02175 [Fodinibius sp.]|nr:hypothetical protein [Fodinibius sp.]